MLLAQKLEREAMALRSAMSVAPQIDQLAADLRARLADITATSHPLVDLHAETEELAAGAAYDELLRLSLSTEGLLAAGDRRRRAPIPASAVERSPFVGWRCAPWQIRACRRARSAKSA